eukprot:gnl/MRDRNA2_/MRDRNA2_15996_c0_seq1.p2 gnl/MRDRNA2_/MRDRNA2_15996_c0~~gnl/MRDRNA2_/MRDRNA2_15996_c0_seq1.p2  ORF type:complete len:153 (-),score=20.70 gnl/MRDRNA2_/MRDRNA2_15996_c0_seq1:109-567(-)
MRASGGAQALPSVTPAEKKPREAISTWQIQRMDASTLAKVAASIAAAFLVIASAIWYRYQSLNWFQRFAPSSADKKTMPQLKIIPLGPLQSHFFCHVQHPTNAPIPRKACEAEATVSKSTILKVPHEDLSVSRQSLGNNPTLQNTSSIAEAA